MTNLLDNILAIIPEQYHNAVRDQFDKAWTGILLTSNVGIAQLIAKEDLPVYLRDISEGEFHNFVNNIEIDFGDFEERYVEPAYSTFDLDEKRNEFRDKYVIPWLWENWEKYEDNEFEHDYDLIVDACAEFGAFLPDDEFYIEQIVREFWDDRDHEHPDYRKIQS